MKHTFTLLTFCLISFGLMAQLDTVTADTTIFADMDNTLYQDANNELSNGAGDHIFAGLTNAGDIRRALLHFDIAGSLPANSTIDSVALIMFCDRVAANTPEFIALHEVETAWGEAGSNANANPGQGATPQTGDATWMYAQYMTDPWTVAGGDFNFAFTSVRNVAGAANTYTWSEPAMVTQAQSWFDAPDDNFGWMLKNQTEGANATAKRFASREAGPNGPRLFLRYTYVRDTTNSVNELGGKSPITVYPNPANGGSFQVKGDVTLKSADIFDVSGRLVRSVVFRSKGITSETISTAGMQEGVYFIRVETESGDFTERLIVR